MSMNLHQWAIVTVLAGSVSQGEAASLSGTITYTGAQTGRVIVTAAQTAPGNKVLTLDGVDDFARIDSLRDLSGSEWSIGYWFRGNSLQSAVRQFLRRLFHHRFNISSAKIEVSSTGC